MKKIYSNPEMYLICLKSELLTLNVGESAEEVNLIFPWGGARRA